MRLEPKNLFIGFLVSPFLCSIIVPFLYLFFFDEPYEIEIKKMILLCLRIGFFQLFLGGPILLLLTRIGRLNFVGFLSAGIVAGFLMALVFKTGYAVSKHFPVDVSNEYLFYVFVISVIVAIAVWAISAINYFFDRLRGIERILK